MLQFNVFIAPDEALEVAPEYFLKGGSDEMLERALEICRDG